MLLVYHYPLCPFSRKLRITLKERGIEFELVTEEYWKAREGFIKLSPEGQTPLIVNEKKKKVLSGVRAIDEDLEENDKQQSLIGKSKDMRLEVRRLLEWFDVKFYSEVTRYIIKEKILRIVTREGQPNSGAIRAAKKNLLYHLDYIQHLTKKTPYLCGDEPMLADFAAASHLSVLDYIDDIDWQGHNSVKQWYSLIKSRPSFRPLLSDKVPNIYPPKHYNNLDF